MITEHGELVAHVQVYLGPEHLVTTCQIWVMMGKHLYMVAQQQQ